MMMIVSRKQCNKSTITEKQRVVFTKKVVLIDTLFVQRTSHLNWVEHFLYLSQNNTKVKKLNNNITRIKKIRQMDLKLSSSSWPKKHKCSLLKFLMQTIMILLTTNCCLCLGDHSLAKFEDKRNANVKGILYSKPLQLVNIEMFYQFTIYNDRVSVSLHEEDRAQFSTTIDKQYNEKSNPDQQQTLINQSVNYRKPPIRLNYTFNRTNTPHFQALISKQYFISQGASGNQPLQQQDFKQVQFRASRYSRMGLNWFITLKLKDFIFLAVCTSQYNHAVPLICAIIFVIYLFADSYPKKSKQFKNLKYTVPYLSILINMQNNTLVIYCLVYHSAIRLKQLFRKEYTDLSGISQYYSCQLFTPKLENIFLQLFQELVVILALVVSIMNMVFQCSILFQYLQNSYKIYPPLRVFLFGFSLIWSIFIYWAIVCWFQKGVQYYLFSLLPIAGHFFKAFMCQIQIKMQIKMTNTHQQNLKTVYNKVMQQHTYISFRFWFSSHFIIIFLVLLGRFYPMIHFTLLSDEQMLIFFASLIILNFIGFFLFAVRKLFTLKTTDKRLSEQIEVKNPQNLKNNLKKKNTQFMTTSNNLSSRQSYNFEMIGSSNVSLQQYAHQNCMSINPPNSQRNSENTKQTNQLESTE